MNLYIVATPIGNLQDITLRAAEVLLKSNIVICESASKAGIMLAFISKTFGSQSYKPRIISLTENEEEAKIPMILKILEDQNAALISEAGTPLISDPGFKLVRQAIKNNVKVIPIPGPSAPIAALSASGLPTDRFLFIGFLPKREAGRRKQLESLKEVLSPEKKFMPTVILFEAPHRVVECLQTIKSVFGNIDIVMARELTKSYEEFRRQKIDEMIEGIRSKQVKGEVTLLFSLK